MLVGRLQQESYCLIMVTHPQVKVTRSQQHHGKGKAPKTEVRFLVRKKLMGCSPKTGLQVTQSGNLLFD